jgi:thiol-disulfide isomerase/thioredoxin
MKIRSSLLFVLLLSGLCGLVGCGGDAGDETATTAETGTPAAKTDARMAPDFTLTALDGTTLHLADMRGDVVLVDFWATWCGPCKIAMPGLQKLHEEYGAQGVRVLALSVDQKGETVVRPFIEQNGYTFAVALADEATRRAYGGIQSIPTTVIIRPDGTVHDMMVGAHPYEAYEKAVLAARAGETHTEH